MVGARDMFIDAFAPFWMAAALLVALVGFEAMGVVFGFSSFSDSADSEGALPDALSWLNRGRVPLLVLAMIMLGLFAASGFILQAAARSLFGAPLPALAAGAIAGGLTLILTGWASQAVAAVLPRDESYAAAPEDLLGRTGTVTLGPLTAEAVGRARVEDAHGNLHFPLVRPLEPGMSIAEGVEVVLAQRAGAEFRVTPVSALPGPVAARILHPPEAS